jgi:hypothetical protein
MLEGWYEDELKKLVFDAKINSQKDLDKNDIEGNYIGESFSGINEATGNRLNYNADGSITDLGANRLAGTTVTAQMTDHQRIMSNPIVQNMHKAQGEFWDSPATKTVLSLLPVGSIAGGVSWASRGASWIGRGAIWASQGAKALFLESKAAKVTKEESQFMKYQGNFVLKSGWKNWGNYMSKRGWSFDDIQQTLLKGKWTPHSGTNYINPGNSMSIVTNHSTGKSLVIDNITKEIIQLGGSGFKY